MRYYIRIADKIEWADRPEDLMQHLPRLDDLPPGFEPPQPISVTFIPATRRFETIAGRVQAAW